MKIKLEDIKVNNFVHCTGNSGFCDSSDEKVKKITVQYDENTGKPYNVIWLSGERKFDARCGRAITPPIAYYLMPTEQKKAEAKQKEIEKQKTEREMNYIKERKKNK